MGQNEVDLGEISKNAHFLLRESVFEGGYDGCEDEGCVLDDLDDFGPEEQYWFAPKDIDNLIRAVDSPRYLEGERLFAQRCHNCVHWDYDATCACTRDYGARSFTTRILTSSWMTVRPILTGKRATDSDSGTVTAGKTGIEAQMKTGANGPRFHHFFAVFLVCECQVEGVADIVGSLDGIGRILCKINLEGDFLLFQFVGDSGGDHKFFGFQRINLRGCVLCVG